MNAKSINVKLRCAKVIRVLTNAPVFAAIVSTILFFTEGGFANSLHYVGALGFLVVLPLLSYPVAWFIPALRKKGRKAERTLAIIFSLAGYIGGFLMAMLGGGTPLERIMFGTYLISGALIGLFTALHFKASGHTCGCSGPIAMLSIFVSPWFLFSYLLIMPVVWASRYLKRHTHPQLLVGSIIPVVSMLLCCCFFLP